MHRRRCEVGAEARWRDEEEEEACDAACEVSHGAGAACCCRAAGEGEAEDRDRQVVEDPDRAADSARMVKADAGLGWDDREACRSGRWVAYPSCLAAVDRWGRVGPCLHEDHGETWEEAKEVGGGACRQVGARDLRGLDRKAREDSLARSGMGLEEGGVA